MAPHCSVPTIVDILHTKLGIPLDIPNIDTVPWEELGVDSLGLTELGTCLEIEHGITVPIEDVASTQNIQELITLINSRQN